MGSTLFVSGADVGDSVSVVIQLIIQIENRASRIAKNRVYLLLQQAFHYNFCASHFHKHVSFSVYLTTKPHSPKVSCAVCYGFYVPETGRIFRSVQSMTF